MHDIEHLFYKDQRDKSRAVPLLAVRREEMRGFFPHAVHKDGENPVSCSTFTSCQKDRNRRQSGGFAFLRKSHAGCGAPPAHRQEPAFDSTLTQEKRQPLTGSPIYWWRRVDSNHRSRRQQIYSLPPLATRELLHIQLGTRKSAKHFFGRGRRRPRIWNFRRKPEMECSGLLLTMELVDGFEPPTC